LCDRLQACFAEGKYDLVMVQGDTTSAMTASLVAFYNHIKVAHVEAGLRTYNKFSPFPEEINRQIISRIADYHFAPTKKAMDLLAGEGTENCFLVGNTVIDSLLLCLQKVELHKERYNEKYQKIDAYRRLVLITGHRRENFGNGFDEICAAIKHLSAEYPDYLFYYPVHLNPNVKDKVFHVLDGVDNIFLDEPLPYDELVYLMSRSYIILTDSGGIQEEGPSLNVPILVMRDTTERPEGIENGCAVMVGTSAQKIISVFNNLVKDEVLYRKMSQTSNPYGDGTAARQIAGILLKEQPSSADRLKKVLNA
jgi:UDP-N-acetylglucosamine 2-epimerase (non-hydrolysing)